ncbi:hypothetical protein FA95DRAFT_116160 [Auriscalpium vulgare]|uniref:Uncharacterized protein n=1 Tax=Auriscalpium vulgare TaxID=40419 RepID=A0ACB8RMX0_9AGAM|nr:hypothetical protein FA95DRAFT_116160 [Auriscalpium vulgare]
MRVVRARRNTLLPVSRLPPEIIEKVFVWLCLLDPLTVTSLGWIPRATHVCQAWRLTAIGYPRLWATIALPIDSRWEREMLDRCQQYPLSISAFYGSEETYEWPYTAYVIRYNLERTKNLQIVHRDRRYYHPLVPNTPCPILESLDLKVESSLTPGLPGNFTNHAPALREIRLETPSAFNWASPCLATLASLEVQSANITRQNMPRLEDVVEALRRMVVLENFTLAIVFAASLPQAVDVFELPRMANFKLTASIFDAQRLLQRIELPTTSQLCISLTGSPGTLPEDGDPTAFLSTLRSFLHGPGKPIMKLLVSSRAPWSVPITSGSKISVMAWRGTRRTGMAPDSMAPIAVHFPPGSMRWGRGTLTPTAVRIFASEHLIELAMLDVAWNENTWATVLPKIPAVQSVEAARSAAAALCRLLEPGISGTPTALVLPALSSLRLRDVSLRASYVPGVPRLGDALLASLAARAAAGHALKMLELRRCPRVRPAQRWQLHAVLPNYKFFLLDCEHRVGRRGQTSSSEKGDTSCHSSYCRTVIFFRVGRH